MDFSTGPSHTTEYQPSTTQQHQQNSPRRTAAAAAASYTPSVRSLWSEDMANDDEKRGNVARTNQLIGDRVASSSISPRLTGRDSPLFKNVGGGFGESQALAIPGSATKIRRNQLSSPSFSAASVSPLMSSASAPFYFTAATASTSQNTLSGMSRFNLASSSNQSLYNLASASNNLVGNKEHQRESQTGSGSSNHSRHSSGYASSLGGGGGLGGGNSRSAFADYSSSNLNGSATSFSPGGSGSAEGLSFTNGKANVSVGSLTSALARSRLSEQQGAIQMSATSSYGSSGGASAESHAEKGRSSSLSQPTNLRQSFSDESAVNLDAGSPAISQRSSASSQYLQVPLSSSSNGPASSNEDPRTQLGITNLPYRVRWQDLKDLFRKAGTVLRADVSLTTDNRSRGYGTVLMASEDDAVRACDMFRGFNWQGRTLDVVIDRSGTLLASHEAGTSSTSDGIQSITAGPPLKQHQTLLHHSGSLPSGISPALLPFLGASNRNSMSGSSSHSQAGSAQLSSSPSSSPIHASMLQSTTNGTHPFYLSQSMQPPYLSQGQGMMLPLGQVSQQQNNYQQPLFYSPSFAGPSCGVTQQQYGNSFVSRPLGQVMMNPYTNVNQGAPVLLPPSLPQVPQSSNSYYGRVLFVGNLPFHCQWQDLKDLFRSAGNIQRADVALSAEGKSRGFGTVLFASAEDAQNAVRFYHGHEYSGRTLKVHFDRFAQLTTPLPGTIPSTASQYTLAFSAANTPSTVSSSSASQAQHHQQSQGQQQQQQQHSHAQPQTQHQLQHQNGITQQHLQLYQMPSNATLHSAPTSSILRNVHDENENSRAAEYAPHSRLSDSAYGRANTTADARIDNFKSSSIRPERISLPPQGFPGEIISNQNMNFYNLAVPMTPSMPGFTFHAIPQTPPAYHQFLSPGLNGPFSPPLSSPLLGPATPGAGSGAFNPHLNHAPGAPIHFSNGMTTPISNVLAGLPPGYNPMFPPTEMIFPQSPPLQHPQQHFTLPQTPHWSQPQRRQTKQKVEPLLDEDITKDVADSTIYYDRRQDQDQSKQSLHHSSSVDHKDDEEGYPFPPVNSTMSSHSQRRASTNSTAVTPMNGPNSNAPPKSPGWERRGSLALNMSSFSIDDPSSTSRLGLRRLLASNGDLSKSGKGDEGETRQEANLGSALEISKSDEDGSSIKRRSNEVDSYLADDDV